MTAVPSILVVEDNPTTRKMLRLALVTEGYTVREAADARAALAAAEETLPDLVLQDLILPDMDGLELLRRFRALPGGHELPILALSGFLSRLEEAKTDEEGFTALFVKPIESSRLIDAIRVYLPQPPSLALPRGGGHRLLVVDDDPVQLKLTRLHFSQLGFDVSVAGGASDALIAARARRPDVILSDVFMPGTDGFELCLEVRTDPNLAHMPVVLLSAQYGSQADEDLARRVGASALVLRTPDFGNATPAIMEALETRAPAPVEQPSDQLALSHARLVIHQLERQIAATAGLAQRCGIQAGQLSLLSGVADALTRKSDPDVALRDVLAATLDAAGISKGALILTDGTGVLALRQAIGFSEAERSRLQNFFGHVAMLAELVDRGGSVSVPSSAIPDDTSRDILAGANITAAQIVPLMSEGRGVGAMIIGATGNDVTSDDCVAFARAMGNQVVQSLELARSVASLSQERDRAQRYLDTAEVLLLATDVDGRVTLINRKGCDILGWAEGELLGRDFNEMCIPARIRIALREKRQRVLDGDASVVENPIVTKSGDERLIEWHNSTQRDDAGRVIGTFSSGTDVTERHQAETQVRLQSAALNAAANAMVITDRAGLIEWVNPAFCELTGYTDAEAVGRNPRDLVKSDQHDQPFNENLWATILRGEVWRGEIINRRKDGSLYTEEQTITPLRDPQGEISHFIDVKQDITERKRAEDQFRQRAQLSALSAAVGLALADSDELAHALQRCAEAIVTHLGATFARIWTLNEDQGMLELRASAGLYTHVNGRHGRVPLGQFKIGRIARDRKPHLTNTVVGDPEVSEQEWARREGMVAFAGHPLIVDGRVVGVMALFARHTISDDVIAALASVADHVAVGIERHRSAEALRTTEERMRFALQSADVGIWDMDYTTGVLRWSETIEAHYGLQPGTFGGTFEAFVERVHPDDRASLLETVGKAMNAGADFSTLHRTRWPDGEVRWLSGAGRVLLDDGGAPVRAVGISLDVTERRSLEEQYQQAQKMEAVGRLAGGVAHDFNNLLTVILGYCELLLEDFKPGDRHQADIAQIQNAGARAGGLTRQLLAFSRKQIIEPTLLDLNLIATDMRAMLGRLIGEDVKVVLALRPELAPVTADRGQVEQVVMNLAVNARDAMPKGGTLTIETANVELDEHYAKTHQPVKPGSYVALTVSDTGTGMTPEVQARLFEPFFTTKEVGKGTGLGMATVYGIVSRSGGSVGVYSEIGKGTSFKVYFPRAGAADMVLEAPIPVTPARVGTQTVLVVEDEGELRELARRLLQRQGYTVLVAANADEALRLFEANQSIDVLLTDVVMPGASGPALTRQLVEQRPALRVIYMSGYTEDAIVHHGVLKPGIAFLNKPFTSETLGARIREVLER
jgi:two-component system cell cycle sensor histidine kinase/response regulator CckA